MSTQVETSRTLDVPVRTAYDQWTQFEDFKLFMDGVEGVKQLGDDRLRFTYKRRGVERTWDARITEQIPDTRIAWESDTEEPEHAGVVTFHRIDDQHSKVMVQFDFWPNGFFEHYADQVGLVEQYVGRALDDFKGFIEDRKRPTGSWRGVVGRDDLTDGGASTTGGASTPDAPAPDPDDRREPMTAQTPPSDLPTAGERHAEPVSDERHAEPVSDERHAAPASDERHAEPVAQDPHTAADDDPSVRTMADGEIVVDHERRNG
jgi:hypothetical protein